MLSITKFSRDRKSVRSRKLKS